MTTGTRRARGIFGRFGDEIELRSYDDLLDKLSVVDRPVPGRTEGRRQADRERYCIVSYLLHLAEAGLHPSRPAPPPQHFLNGPQNPPQHFAAQLVFLVSVPCQ